MNFHSMKRVELQALCKKHKIPANLSNHEMANRLTEFLKEKKDPLSQGTNSGEIESTNVVMNRKVKKVRFSPEHELIEFTRSRDPKGRSKRNAVSSRCSSLPAETVNGGEMNRENVGSQGRVTRSRGLKLVEGKANEKKRARNGVKLHDQKNNADSVENFDNSELREGAVNSPRRVTGLRGKTLVAAVKNESKRERKRSKNGNKTDQKAPDNADDKKLEGLVDIPGRITRSRGQKLMEASLEKQKRGRNVSKNNENVRLISAESDDKEVVSRSCFRDKDKSVKNKGKGEEVVAGNQKITGVHQIALRRSNRNANRIGGSENVNDDKRKHENGGNKGLRETPKSLTADRSGKDQESAGGEIVPDSRVVVQIEEPVKLGLRRSNRRKTAILSHEKQGDPELKAEIENRYPLRSSVPQLGAASGVSNDNEKIPRPTEFMRRSRRKASSPKPDPSEEIIAAGDNLETEKSLSKPCLVEKGNPVVQKNTRRTRRNTSKHESPDILQGLGGDFIVQQNHEARKQKRGAEDFMKTNNDPNTLTHPMRKETTGEKDTPADAAVVKVAEKRKPPSGWKQQHAPDASSIESSLETGNSSTDAQVPVPEVAESSDNPCLSSGTCAKNICSGAGLTSSEESHRRDKNVSVAEGAGSPNMNLIKRNELANSGEKAEPRTGDFEADRTDSEKQISSNNFRDAEIILSSFRFDVQESTEEYTSETDKNDPEPQVFGQTEDSSCNNMTDSQLLPEDMSGNVGFAEISSSANSLLLHDRTDFKTDLEATEGQVDKYAQPRLDVLDRVCEARDVSVHQKLESVETGHANAIGQSIACHHNDGGPLESSNDTRENNNDNTVLNAGDGTSQLKEPTSSKQRITQEDDNSAEGDETDEGGCLKDHKSASNEVKDLSMSDLFDGESDRSIAQAEHSFVNSDEKGTHDDSLPVAPITVCANGTETNLVRGLEDHIAKRHEPDVDDSIRSDSAKTDGGTSKDQKSEYGEEDGEFMANLFDSESRARVTTHNRQTFSTEYSMNDSTEHGPFPGFPVSTMCANYDEVKFSTGSSSSQEIMLSKPNNITESQEKAGASDTSQGKENAICQQGEEMTIAVIARVGEHEIANQVDEHSNEDIYAPEPQRGPLAKPIAIANTIQGQDAWSRGSEEEDMMSIFNTNLGKTSQVVQGSNIDNDAKTDEDGSSADQKVECSEEDGEFMSNLFDSESGGRITSKDREAFSAEYAVNNSNEQGMFSDFPAVSTTGANCKHVEFISTGGSTRETIMSVANNISKSEAGPADTTWENGNAICHGNMREEMSVAKTTRGREHEIENQADEHSNEYTNEPAEQLKSPPARPTPIANTIQGQEAWSSGIEKGHTMSTFKTDGEGKPGEDVQGSNTDDVANDANWSKDKEDFADACTKDVAISVGYSIPKTEALSLSESEFESMEEAEHQCRDPLTKHTVSSVGEVLSDMVSSQSRTEIELNNMSGTTVDDFTPGLNDTRGTEIEDLTMLMKNSIVQRGGSLTKMKKEMEGERGSESAKTTNESAILPTKFKEISHTESNLDREENELELLFATPVKVVTPCNVNETSAHDRNLDRTAMSFQGCIETMVANIVTRIRSDEGIEDAGHELENGLSLTDNGEGVTYAELNEVESMELVNTSTIKDPSDVEYNVYEASEEQLTQNVCEFKKEETNTVAETNPNETIFSIGQCSDYKEAKDNDSESSEKNIIGASGDVDTVCRDMLMDTDFSENLSCRNTVNATSDGEMAQRSEAAAGPSDADFQMSNDPESSHHFTACYADGNMLRETSTENLCSSSGAPMANFGSFDSENNVIEKGMSPNAFPKVSHDSEEVTGKDAKSLKEEEGSYEDKIWDGANCNPRSTHYILDEQHTNSEVANLEASGGCTLGMEADKPPTTPEFHSTCKETVKRGRITENANEMVPSADHGSSVCVVQSDFLSSSAMHLLLGDSENGGIEKSGDGIPFFNSEAGQEMDAKHVEENTTSTIQFAFSELDLEAKSVELNNDVHSVSNVPASVCNEVLKESDVADTIKEYIDSESSVAADLDDSGTWTHIEVKTLENVALGESQQDISEKFANSDGDDVKPSVETERKGMEEATSPVGSSPVGALTHIEVKTSENAPLAESQEEIGGRLANSDSDDVKTEQKELEQATSSVEPVSGSKKAVKSPACINLLEQVSAVNGTNTSEMVSRDGNRSSSKHYCTTAIKNAKTILIHGTPRKHLTTAVDMKENAPSHKTSNIGDLTTARPAKRRALQDVQWK